MKGKDNILMNLMYDKKISIELCDNNSGYSSARCNNSSRCPGANNGNCNPNDVWSGDEYNSSNAYNYYLNSGSWNRNWNNRTNAFSVRCVTDFLEQIDFALLAKFALRTKARFTKVRFLKRQSSALRRSRHTPCAFLVFAKPSLARLKQRQDLLFFVF